MVMLAPSRPSLGSDVLGQLMGLINVNRQQVRVAGIIPNRIARIALLDSSVFHSGSIHMVCGRLDTTRWPNVSSRHPLPWVA